MLSMFTESDKLLLEYKPDNGTKWIANEIKNNNYFILKKTFKLNMENLPGIEFSDLYEEEPDSITITIGFLEGDYFKIKKEILSINHDLFIHKSLSPKIKMFISEKNVSIFRYLDTFINHDIYIGGDLLPNLPTIEFKNLLKNFPNSYELKKYVQARIGGVLKNYFEIDQDFELRYQKYLNKKIKITRKSSFPEIDENEIAKFDALLDQMINMLESESEYSENQWQLKIIKIVQLLYPKYIAVFDEVQIRDTYENTNKRLDYMLVDSTGNIDIIEIKKPFQHKIMSTTKYRDNFIPMRELSGTIMQIEKYIFYLNKWGKKGEEALTEKYKDKLPNGLRIKIINPNGIIIMGRDDNLDENQLKDFEVVKRKYKNILEILTYDDLIRRLKIIRNSIILKLDK